MSSSDSKEPLVPSQQPSDVESLHLVSHEVPIGAQAVGQLLPRDGSPTTCSSSEDLGERTTKDVLGVLSDSAACVPLQAEFRQSFTSKLPTRKAAAGLAGSRSGARASYLPQASPSKAVLDKKGPAGSATLGAMGRKTQGLLSECLPGPRPFPLMADVPALGRGGQGTMALRGSRLPRRHPRKKPMFGSMRENAMLAQDDATGKKQPATQEQFLADRTRLSHPAAYHGACHKAGPKSKSRQDPGGTQPFVVVQEDIQSRPSLLSDAHRPPPRRQRKGRRQLPPRLQSCHRCHLLERHISRLQDQIEKLQCVDGKSQVDGGEWHQFHALSRSEPSGSPETAPDWWMLSDSDLLAELKAAPASPEDAGPF
ncbi:uncharacterized protein CXorf49 homolog isoform X2 [Ochotona princeps]|uniref:uncharacterized protein CXorf49 homolog isoform X2 n=1 Tax=Ochotona princeps TaxID=9978 RepID=UPI002714D44A|nr:uncharacterized protein CXorf49 homolog isoform X2 [Ochotona princeps]